MFSSTVTSAQITAVFPLRLKWPHLLCYFLCLSSPFLTYLELIAASHGYLGKEPDSAGQMAYSRNLNFPCNLVWSASSCLGGIMEGKWFWVTIQGVFWYLLFLWLLLEVDGFSRSCRWRPPSSSRRQIRKFAWLVGQAPKADPHVGVS